MRLLDPMVDRPQDLVTIENKRQNWDFERSLEIMIMSFIIVIFSRHFTLFCSSRFSGMFSTPACYSVIWRYFQKIEFSRSWLHLSFSKAFSLCLKLFCFSGIYISHNFWGSFKNWSPSSKGGDVPHTRCIMVGRKIYSHPNPSAPTKFWGWFGMVKFIKQHTHPSASRLPCCMLTRSYLYLLACYFSFFYCYVFADLQKQGFTGE